MERKYLEYALKKAEEFKPLMFETERWLWQHPQTGFKEWHAHKYLKEKFEDMGFFVKEVGDIPGFYFDIETGKDGVNLAIIGELDALVVPEHPECDKSTGAVHACGHHCQVSALLGVAGVLNNKEILSDLCGKIRIVAVPAEELIELSERAQMRKNGQLKYLSGKSEFIRKGIFDDVDIALMIHTSIGEKARMFIGAGTTGIMAKRITYHGSKNVGGAWPFGGVNALSMAQTALNSINAMREIFPDWCRVRHQAVIKEGGVSVVHMPSEVVIESHIRATNFNVLKDVNEKVNRAHVAAATAFGGEVEIEDLECYIPENDCEVPKFMQLAYEVASELFGSENVQIRFDKESRSSGGTDMGNLGAIIPVIQPYSTGQVGCTHGDTFEIKYPEYAVFHPAVVQATVACELLKNDGEKAKEIISEYKPLFSSVEEYLQEMDKIYFSKKGIEYNEKEKNANLRW